IGSSPNAGVVSYYAERTPELPQTLKFVIDVIKKGNHDPALVEYAIALVFGEGRAAGDYEARGETMASDLADGWTPEIEKQFYQAVLDIRKTPNLADELFKRMDGVYERVLPGYSPDYKPVPGTSNFVIGPERQMDLYQAYLKSAVGTGAQLYRLYPRDFWMVIDPDKN
ncbi:MAG TPA: hypothetical protein VFC63_12615, partial [Blastocatellia bacterium]|nr:hypothetical protein [Blastocatellia bacterium]